MTIQEFEAMRLAVDAGTTADPTPFGMDGDHCPMCGQDWRAKHDDGCESPYAEAWNAHLNVMRALSGLHALAALSGNTELAEQCDAALRGDRLEQARLWPAVIDAGLLEEVPA